MLSKKALSEAEICDRYITPGLKKSGWNQDTQIRREYSFTAGRVIVRGAVAIRGKKKRADYLLNYRSHLPLAVVEAKDNTHSVDSGIQQARGYAEALDVPFAFSSNGDAFLFYDRTGLYSPVENQLKLDEFPSPEKLWSKYRVWKGLDAESERYVLQPYHEDSGGKEARYYQRVAIQRAVEAIARGQRRVLLVMATGTGIRSYREPGM